MSFVTRSEFREVLLSLYKDIQKLREQISKSHQQKHASQKLSEQITVTKLDPRSSIETRTPSKEQTHQQRYQCWSLIIQVVTLLAVIAYAVITGKMWRQMQGQTETGQKQLEQSERAWLKVSITADSGFEFTADRGGRITVRTHIQNIGNSAATNIVTGIKLILAPMNDSSGGREFFTHKTAV